MLYAMGESGTGPWVSDTALKKCVVSRAAGKPLRAGVLHGSVVISVNGACDPTVSEIETKDERLSPAILPVQLVLERPLPLPAKEEKLNPTAFLTRQSACGPSGRMLDSLRELNPGQKAKPPA